MNNNKTRQKKKEIMKGSKLANVQCLMGLSPAFHQRGYFCSMGDLPSLNKSLFISSQWVTRLVMDITLAYHLLLINAGGANKYTSELYLYRN